MTQLEERKARRAELDARRANQNLWCPRCRSRFHIPQGPPRDFMRLRVPHATIGLMRDAARLFDEITERHGDSWTALDFTDWLSRDLEESA